MSPEEYEERRNYIGASDAAIILNGSDVQKYYLWLEKLAIRTNTFDNYAMSEGRRKEPLAREWISNQLGIIFWPTKVVSKEYPFMRASMDGLDFSNTKGCEIKCPQSRSILEKAQTRQYYEDHLIQMNQQMIVLSIREIYYVIYFDDNDAHYFLVERDDDLCEKIIKANTDFWALVESRTPPVTLNSSFEWKKAEEDYIEAYKNKKIWEEKLKASDSRLKELATDKSTVGERVIVSCYVERGRVKYKDIPQLKDVNLDEYRDEPKLYKRITIKKEKE